MSSYLEIEKNRVLFLF